VKRKIPWKRISIIAGVIVVIVVAVEVILAGRDSPPIPVGQSGISLSRGHVNGNKISTKSWTFDYQSAQLSADGSVGTVQGVKNGIVYKKGKPYLKISAESIAVDTNALNFVATGKVHAQLINDPQQRSFDTDLIAWTNSTKTLQMEHPSYLHSQGQTLKLETVSIDFNKDEIHLGKIGGTVEMPKK
jgi:hypothetical protein